MTGAPDIAGIVSFSGIGGHGDYWLANARVPAGLIAGGCLSCGPDGLAEADIHIAEGLIRAIEPPGPRSGHSIDLDHGMVWPGLVDMHTHLDKGHIWPRTANPDGTFEAGLASASADRDAYWSAEDVARRMDFSLRTAFAHGTVAIRTHLDSVASQYEVSWDVFDSMRAQWADRITLQGVSLFPIDDAADGDFLAAIASRVAKSGAILGAVTFANPMIEVQLRNLFAAAGDHGLDLDLHVDENLNPTSMTLRLIARMAIETGFDGRIVCGHCCSLSALPDEEIGPVLDLVAEAGLAFVSLPMCNLYLQDRSPGASPRRRGLTLIREMMARGIPIAVASDNTRDPFYAYGDLDALEVLREAVRIAHLDHPIDDAPALVTRTPAQIMGLGSNGRIAVGGQADLVVFSGRSYTELLARPQSDRMVLRNGRAIERRLPDYRELDDLVGRP